MPDIAGGCLCGKVRYVFDAPPLVTAACHCLHCRKLTGAAFSVVVAVSRQNFRLEGEAHLMSYQDVGDSGQPVQRRFCGGCGSQLMSEPAITPDRIFLRAGTLDDPSGFKPQINLWCDSALPWVAIDADLPRYAKNPSRRA